jgi:hypothetical protein
MDFTSTQQTGTILEFFPFFLMILILIIFLGYAVYAKTMRNRIWGELASSLGLSFTPANLFFGTPRIIGAYRGHSINLETFTRTYGKSRQIFTRVYLTLNCQSDFSLKIANENIFSKIGKKLGQEDIEIGNEEIDRRFVITGSSADAIKRVFYSMKLQQELQEFHARFVVEAFNNSVLLEKRGANDREDQLRFMIDFISDLADGIERNV